MNVLIVGGGGREHAIVWALSKSEQVEQLYCAPGNGGIAALAQRVRNQLDALGATNTKITVTNDRDGYALASLQTAPVDSYGVGTTLGPGPGAPP